MTDLPDIELQEGKIHAGLRLDLNRPWAEVLHLAKKYEYSKRAYIHLSREMESDFYYISHGKVCLQVTSATGKERTTNFFGEGCLFNLATVFVKDYKDAGVWVALADTVIWRFPGTLLHDEKFVREHPALIINLMSSICFSIITQYSWLTEMYLATPLPRICRYLVGLAVNAGVGDSLVGVTQLDAALQLGIHRGTLSVALKQLKEQGILSEFSRGRLHILDMERLRQISEL